jgi:hypothetical protein
MYVGANVDAVIAALITPIPPTTRPPASRPSPLQDFLPTLLAELEARGLYYDVAARVTNI